MSNSISLQGGQRSWIILNLLLLFTKRLAKLSGLKQLKSDLSCSIKENFSGWKCHPEKILVLTITLL